MRKKPKVNIEYARQWRARKVRDTRTNEIGLVIDACETDEGVRLVCYFKSRGKVLVALERTPDFECLVPDLARARYRLA